MRQLVLVVIAACACPNPQPAPLVPATGSAARAATCDGIKPKVEQLYRAEAQAKEPKRIDDAVADNTAMVMAECAKDPAHVTACIDQAQAITEVEQRCLAPLDEEGTEGEVRR